MESFLSVCPTEVLFEICYHLDDHRDLLSLSRSSRWMQRRLGEFIRVVKDHEEQLIVFKEFGSFCRVAGVHEPIPDWSITLLEVWCTVYDAPMIPKNYRTLAALRHTKVHMTMVPYPEDCAFHCTTTSIQESRTTSLLKTSSDVLANKFILVTSDDMIKVPGGPLENLQIQSLRPYSVDITRVNYSGKFPFPISPRSITLKDCAPGMLQGFKFDNVEELRIIAPPKTMRDELVSFDAGSISVQYSVAENTVRGLCNMSFPSLKILAVDSLNYLTDLELPVLECFYARLSPVYSGQNQCTPLLKNINIGPSRLDRFELDCGSHAPTVINCNFPESATSSRFSFMPTEDPTSTLPQIRVPQGQCKVLNMLRLVEPETHQNIVFLETETDADLLLLTSEKTVMMDSLEELVINKDLPPLDPKIRKRWGNEYFEDVDKVFDECDVESLNVYAPDLKHFLFKRQTGSKLRLNWSDLAKNHTQLEVIEIVREGTDLVPDICCGGDTSFPQLKELKLEGLRSTQIMGLLLSMDFSKMEQLRKVVLTECLLDFDHSKHSQIYVTKLLSLLEPCQSTLTTISFQFKRVPHRLQTPEPLPIEVHNFTSLQELRFSGCGIQELELKNCRRLRAISICAGRTPLRKLTADSLPELKNLRYDVKYDRDTGGDNCGRRRSIQDMCDQIEHFQELGRISRDIRVVSAW